MVRLRVREIAEQKHITITQLSKKADVSIGTVRSCWYHPEHDVLLSILKKLAGALGVRLTELIDDSPDGPSP